ncbi:MAG: helix-turn-helix transcriptional regulator [Roseitalea porphyridii]
MFSAIELVREVAFIVDQAFQIRSMSQSAGKLIETKDGLIQRNGQILARTPEVTTRLHSAIRAKIQDQSNRPSLPAYLSLPRGGEKHPLALSVQSLLIGEDKKPYVVIFVKDPCVDPNLSHDQLMDVFSLTQSEAHLALHLAKGGSLQEYSDQSHLSLNTVRTHLKHIFIKTDTKRQPELVSLILRSVHAYEDS